MIGLVTSKNEEDPSKNEGTRVASTFSLYKSMGIFSRRSRAANSTVKDPIWPYFEPIRDFIGVLVACKNE